MAPGLVRLGLDHNRVGDAGCIALADALRHGAAPALRFASGGFGMLEGCTDACNAALAAVREAAKRRAAARSFERQSWQPNSVASATLACGRRRGTPSRITRRTTLDDESDEGQ